VLTQGANLKQRPPGMLERMSKAVQKQVGLIRGMFPKLLLSTVSAGHQASQL
jgi:hypothetical protein